MTRERVRLRDLIAEREEKELAEGIERLTSLLAGVKRAIEAEVDELRSLAGKLNIEPEIRKCPEEISSWRPGDALEVVPEDGGLTTVETSLLPLLRGTLEDAAGEIEEALLGLDEKVWLESSRESLLDDLGALPDETVLTLLEAVTVAPASGRTLGLASFRESEGLRASFVFALPGDLRRALSTLTSFLYTESDTTLEIEEGGYFAAELQAHISDLEHTAGRLVTLGDGAEIGREDVHLIAASEEAAERLSSILTLLREALRRTK